MNAFAGIALSAGAQTTAPNEWTWMGGSQAPSSTNGQPGVYGTLGIPAPGNTPGGRDSAATWTDSGGNFWLFGGEGVDANGNFGQLNDLWEFKPSTRQWTWIGGSSTLPANCAGSTTIACGSLAVYGNLGSAAAANIPGGRSVASHWTDGSGNFWLFAGYGFDANQKIGELNDLWEFNPSTKEWTWMGGSSTIGSNGGQPGVYGVLGSAATANIPGGRDSATSWVDKSGQFWLYGGEGFDSQGNYGQQDDLWRYIPSANQWTWMGGGSTLPAACATNVDNNGLCGWPAVYGALGVSAAGISPGSRVGSTSWTDGNGNLWLFGGIGNVYWESRDFSEIDQYDLWEFNTSTQQWAWMSGNSTSICGESSSEDWCGQNGIYGTQGTPSIANIPPSRDGATSWIDATGNLWLFGGAQPLTTNTIGPGDYCNDVWVFAPATSEWAWMNGASQFGSSGYSCSFTNGTYGTQGTPSAANTPSGRLGSASWTDALGNLWLFGGSGLAGANIGDYNDLWIYQPVAPSPKPSFEVIASPNPINIDAIGTGTPTITTGTTTVSIVPADDFNSPVSLTATTDTMNGVTDITGSFSPATITGTGSTTLTVSVTGAAVLIAGPIPLTITATGGGISQSIRVIVDVTSLGLSAPTFSIPTGTYSPPQTVAISGSNFIYYTTDGTTPTASSAVYVNPVTISSTTTLKAIIMDVFNQQSAISSATYTIVTPAAAPIFAPGGGSYSSAQSVTLTDSTPGATFYYTTDGSNPTTNSTVYSSAITVSSSETLNAIGVAPGYSSSAVTTADYTINLPSFIITGTAVSVAAGATTGNTSTINLTPTNGFTGVISLGCTITPTATSDPATCSIPATATISGATAQTATLTVNTTSASAALHPSGRPFRSPWGGTVLACILLVCIPTRRRRWWCTSVLLLFVVAGAVGCDGSSSGSGRGGQNSGTTRGTYVITITGTSGTTTQKGTVSLTVQ